MSYDEFLRAKLPSAQPQGFEPEPVCDALYPWQKLIVEWAVRAGRAALFEDCGLGKTLQQLEWAQQIAEHTGGPVIVLTPLAVAEQTIREAGKFHYPARMASDESDIDGGGVYVTNYEKLDRFNGVDFAGVVLDESSILKNFTGKTRIALTERFSDTPYRLCCTATPSPNDYTELGQHAEFLGVMSSMQMLATYFINDTFNTGDWRLKRHAVNEFWQWVASWAACVNKPSDIGFSDDGYDLPGLEIESMTIATSHASDCGEELFRNPTLSATSMHKEMRETMRARVEAVASEVNSSGQPWIVWCNTNDESSALAEAIPDAVEVFGSQTHRVKEKLLSEFSTGKARVIVTKPGIAGYGLNWQHCCNVAFVGLSYSFEQFYQALRRSYRFGQENKVRALIVQADTEGAIKKAIERKMAQHEELLEQMKIAAGAFRANGKKLTMKTDIHTESTEQWTMHHGDCVRVAKSLSDHSIDLCVFSPPFADLFTYSDDVQDMGNCDDAAQFHEHFSHLVAELRRVMLPGREVCVHCVDLLATKWKHGYIGFQDFSGQIIRLFWEHGFTLHSRITIWKSPVTEMQRTKAHGLLHKTLCKDSAASRVGAPDYLLVFRAPGDNPKPITKDQDAYPVEWWQEVASPVWMTVDQGNVLNKDGARDAEDERHICPLQLDVIHRAVELWSNPDDLVYSPFGGIGSEGYQALKMGRRFVGSELKEGYFRQACQNLGNATRQLEFQLV